MTCHCCHLLVIEMFHSHAWKKIGFTSSREKFIFFEKKAKPLALFEGKSALIISLTTDTEVVLAMLGKQTQFLLRVKHQPLGVVGLDLRERKEGFRNWTNEIMRGNIFYQVVVIHSHPCFSILKFDFCINVLTLCRAALYVKKLVFGSRS